MVNSYDYIRYSHTTFNESLAKKHCRSEWGWSIYPRYLLVQNSEERMIIHFFKRKLPSFIIFFFFLSGYRLFLKVLLFVRLFLPVFFKCSTFLSDIGWNYVSRLSYLYLANELASTNMWKMKNIYMTKWMVTKENTKHLISMSYGFVCAFLCVDQIYKAFLTYGKEN